MYLGEPVNLAMPLAKRLGELVMERGKIPGENEVKEIMETFGLTETCAGRRPRVYEGEGLVALVFQGNGHLVVDVISSTGDLGDALEVVAYHDGKLEAFIVEIVPANDISYEGNVGIEPVIVDEGSLELESSPVLGRFEEEDDGVFLVIDRGTYEKWKSTGDVHVCPVCGGELAWRGEKAICRDCGYGVRVVVG